MKLILSFVFFLSVAAHAVPSGPVLGPLVPMSQEERGKNLAWALMSGDSGIIASYFDDSVKANLTKDKIKKIQSQITWLSKLIGDSLDQFMTGMHRDSLGRDRMFFREYRLGTEINKRAPLIVIHVLYKDSTTTLSAGVFVKTFLEDSEKRLASDLTWTINGKKVDVHSVTLIHLQPGDILAVKVFDDDTTTLDSATIKRKGIPIAREAVAQGFLVKAKAAVQGKTLLPAIGVAFLRKDPHLGYSQFKYGIAQEEYLNAAQLDSLKKTKPRLAMPATVPAAVSGPKPAP
jgi:hypothetical protein